MPLLPDEPRITLSQAASRYPGSHGAARMHPATLTRHIIAGIRGTHGRIVHLEAERIGCRWYTSIQALERFAAALAGDAPSEAAPQRTPTARTKASEAAGRKLAAMGA